MLELTDETKRAIATLNEMDVEDETVMPEELRIQTELMDEDDKRRATEAWVRQRRSLKLAKGVIKTVLEESNKVIDKKPTSVASNGGVDVSGRSAVYMGGLTNEAMTKLGINDPNNDLVKLEVNRLYSRDVARVEKLGTADVDSEKVFQTVMSDFPQLDQSDKDEIKNTLGGLDPLQRTDENEVRSMIHRYIGMNFNKFAKSGNAGSGSAGKVKTGASAISDIKARGGVAPSSITGGDEDPDSVAPLKQEERQGMVSVGLDPVNPKSVALFRRSMRKKDGYNSFIL